ncbi:arylsulfatase B-like [Babylonia areolata]|uniref:arylsulfatase B-like n=1 Tax=Babylonia areolata TaxID=304850 RepID=UPI003FD64B2A
MSPVSLWFSQGQVVLLFFAAFVLLIPGSQAVDSRPHIVFVLADDYGFHDIGYHNSRIRTPVLDRLAAEGVKLENYYVQPSCTPTRSQLMSGRYQIHTGLQHKKIHPDQPSGLPLDSLTIAEVLKRAGYSTHMVGKWHLGYFSPDYLPTSRGFESFYGYLNGAEKYFDHTRDGFLDFYENTTPLRNATGHYSTHLFTQRATEIIYAHEPEKGPLFLYLPYQAVHVPLVVPESYMEQYQDIKDEPRRTYAGMVTCMDEGVGNVTKALKETGLWENTVFIFSTDNGGAFILGSANNYPLRGGKGTLWEGGVHGIGFVHSPLLHPSTRGTINNELIHVSDWFPTLTGLAHGSLAGVKPLDGFDQWDTISRNAPSPRKELLHNIDPLQAPKGSRLYPDTFDTRIRAAIRVGDFKLITGNPGNSLLLMPPEFNLPAISQVGQGQGQGNPLTPVGTGTKPESQAPPTAKNVWLFNVANDPAENYDLSESMPDVVRKLLRRLQDYSSTAVPPLWPKPDPRSNPRKHGGVWGPWKKGERKG